jgi:hypothetical protein
MSYENGVQERAFMEKDTIFFSFWMFWRQNSRGVIGWQFFASIFYLKNIFCFCVEILVQLGHFRGDREVEDVVIVVLEDSSGHGRECVCAGRWSMATVLLHGGSWNGSAWHGKDNDLNYQIALIQFLVCIYILNYFDKPKKCFLFPNIFYINFLQQVSKIFN